MQYFFLTRDEFGQLFEQLVENDRFEVYEEGFSKPIRLEYADRHNWDLGPFSETENGGMVPKQFAVVSPETTLALNCRKVRLDSGGTRELINHLESRALAIEAPIECNQRTVLFHGSLGAATAWARRVGDAEGELALKWLRATVQRSLRSFFLKDLVATSTVTGQRIPLSRGAFELWVAGYQLGEPITNISTYEPWSKKQNCFIARSNGANR